jgi:hypothetical protein
MTGRAGLEVGTLTIRIPMRLASATARHDLPIREGP